MNKEQLRVLLYQYLNNTSDYYYSLWQQKMKNYQRLVKFDCVSRYDLIELHEAQCNYLVFKKISTDLKKILEMDSEF